MAGIYDTKQRRRPERVDISYEVETNGVRERRRLPFTIGVLADLSGDTKPTKSLRERKFRKVDRDTINDVMGSIRPTLQLEVTDLEGKPQTVTLEFPSMDVFNDPKEIIQQVPWLKKLYDERETLTAAESVIATKPALESAIISRYGEDRGGKSRR